MMSYSFALTQPARVAGVIAQSGYIPLPSLNASHKLDEAGIADKPFILTHGTHDPILPVQWGREARDTLIRLNARVNYHEFPIGHQVSEASLAAIADWMGTQLKSEE
jgi:phospholipase/carboxylesterase